MFHLQSLAIVSVYIWISNVSSLWASLFHIFRWYVIWIDEITWRITLIYDMLFYSSIQGDFWLKTIGEKSLLVNFNIVKLLTLMMQSVFCWETLSQGISGCYCDISLNTPTVHSHFWQWNCLKASALSGKRIDPTSKS